jgi:hypothetical protein
MRGIDSPLRRIITAFFGNRKSEIVNRDRARAGSLRFAIPDSRFPIPDSRFTIHGI